MALEGSMSGTIWTFPIDVAVKEILPDPCWWKKGKMIRKPMEKGSVTMKSKPSVIHHNAPLVHSVPINLGPFHLFHLNFQEVPIFINEISFTTNILSLQEFGYFVPLEYWKQDSLLIHYIHLVLSSIPLSIRLQMNEVNAWAE